MGTHVCFLCICAVCVFVLKEDLSKCLVFQCEISVDDVASRIMSSSHKQNLILLIIGQHSNNNSYLGKTPIARRVFGDITCQTTG